MGGGIVMSSFLVKHVDGRNTEVGRKQWRRNIWSTQGQIQNHWPPAPLPSK